MKHYVVKRPVRFITIMSTILGIAMYMIMYGICLLAVWVGVVAQH